MDLWLLHRGFWSYGKWLKQNSIVKNGEPEAVVDKHKVINTETVVYEDDFDSLITLGKQKIFWYFIDSKVNLTVIRNFQNIHNPTKSVFTAENLDTIQNYMETKVDWVPLANNGALMEIGQEIDGIGSFVYNNIADNTTFARAASQLVTIFTVAGIWEWNGRRKGMMFKFIKSADWREALTKYFQSKIDNLE